MWFENIWRSGIWAFPMMMCIIMMFVVPRIFGRGGGIKTPWSQDSDGHHIDSPDSGTGLVILKKRYAKGEITKGEFEQMKRNLLS